MTVWNLADIITAITGRRAEDPAIVDARGTTTWAELDRRTDALAQALVTAGLPPRATVGVFQRNRAEHLEAYVACFKAGLVPFNVNYRYGPGELHHLLTDADASALVMEAEFAATVDALRGDLPMLRSVLVVGGSGEDLPADTVDYETVIAEHLLRGPAGLAARRSAEDLLLIYTGGTTGSPKGVMWRQHDLFEALVITGQQALDLPPVHTVAELVAGLPDDPARGLSAAPLMHSTGLLNQLMVLLAGGCAVMLPGHTFTAAAMWSVVAEQRVTSLSIVGDAFARPMLDWLDAHPGELDLSSLQLIVSSGAMWSDTVQDGLLRHLPQLTLYDAFGSSEGFGLGMSSRTATQPRATAHFRLGPHVRVLADDGRWIGVGEEGIGRAAVSGVLPLGYYKDPDRTRSAFPSIGGVRYSVAGDYVHVFADGTLRLLGRGSACINTGGEKVYAEEVEEVVKTHPRVRDAACVGVPHPRFGSSVCIVVEPSEAAAITGEEIVAFARDRLASYKLPRHVVTTAQLPRTALGKVDYPACREIVLSATSSASAAR